MRNLSHCRKYFLFFGLFLLQMLLVEILPSGHHVLASGESDKVDPAYLAKVLKEKWRFIHTQDNVHVYSKTVVGEGLLAFRGITVVKAPILSVLHALRNVELAHVWTPNLVSKKMLEEYSYGDAVTYNHNSLPWPASDRETVIRSILSVDGPNQQLILNSYSVDHPKAQLHRSLVLANLASSKMIFKPIGNYTFIDLDVFVDPKGLLPSWLINMIQKNWPYSFLKALEQRALVYKFKPHPLFVEMVNLLSAPVSPPKAIENDQQNAPQLKNLPPDPHQSTIKAK